MSAITLAELAAGPHATAGPAALPVYTCNPADFAALETLLEVVAVGPAP